jgi:lipopolysaccharide export system permease protein
MQGVFIAQQEPIVDGGRPLISVVTASQGRFEIDRKSGQRYLVLDDGVRYVGESGFMDYQVTSFARLDQLIRDSEVKTYRQELDGKDTLDLWGSTELEDIAAIQWRISLGLLVPIAAIIAVSLSKTDHRRGRYGKMFPAFMIYMVYLVCLNAIRDAIAKGDWPVFPGMWIVHAAFLLLGLILLYRDSMLRHWWLSWRRRRD